MIKLNDRFSPRLDQLSSELKSVHDELHHQAEMATATDEAKPIYAESVLNTETSREVHASRPAPSQPSSFPRVPIARSDRSLNLVVYGIPECKKGTPKHNRFSNDLTSVTNSLTSLDPIIGDYSIKDCHRLGKYSTQTSHPQPILVKFNRASDVSQILYKRSCLSPPIIIKPDLTPEQRAQEALLLKQRWQLIQSGISRKNIRIRGNKLYVNNCVHGQIINSEYCVSPSSGNVASATNTLSVPVMHKRWHYCTRFLTARTNLQVTTSST